MAWEMRVEDLDWDCDDRYCVMCGPECGYRTRREAREAVRAYLGPRRARPSLAFRIVREREGPFWLVALGHVYASRKKARAAMAAARREYE